MTSKSNKKSSSALSTTRSAAKRSMDKKSTSKNAEKPEKDTSSKSSVSKSKEDVKKNSKKRTFNMVVMLVLLVIAGAVLGGYYLYTQKMIVAKVNGEPISRLDLWLTLEKRYGTQAIDNMVTEKLIAQAAKREGVAITDEEVQQELQNIEQTVTQQGMTLEEALQQQGMTQETLREQIVIRKQLDKLASSEAEVTDEEIDQAISSMGDSANTDDPDFRQQIADQLRQTKQSQNVQNYLEELRNNALIETGF